MKKLISWILLVSLVLAIVFDINISWNGTEVNMSMGNRAYADFDPTIEAPVVSVGQCRKVNLQ